MVATQMTLASAFARRSERPAHTSSREQASQPEATAETAAPPRTRDGDDQQQQQQQQQRAGAMEEDEVEEADDAGAASAAADSAPEQDAAGVAKRLRTRDGAKPEARGRRSALSVENLFASLAGFQTTGRLCTSGKKQAMRISCDSYCQLPPVLLDASWSHSEQPSTWQPQDPARRLPGYRPPGCIAAMEFDGNGELLASAASCGRLRVYDFLSMRHEAQVSAQHRLQYSKAAPVVKIDAERRLSGVRWNRNDQNMVGCVSDDDRMVALYDLQYCKNTPTMELELPSQGGGLGWGGGDVGLRASLGLADLQFVEAQSIGGGFLVAAAGHSGCAALWDYRRGRRPSAVLSAPPRSGALHSLHMSRDGLTLCCGTDGGELMAWDLRGGSGASRVQKFGAGGSYAHPMLFSCPLGPQLRCLTGNGYKGVTGRAVHCVAADPTDDERLAFVLSSGAAGVYDRRAQRVTHFHDPAVQRAPPAAAAGGELGLSGAARNPLQALQQPPQPSAVLAPPPARGCFARRRRGQWWGPGHGFAVGSPFGDDLMLLDFRSTAGNMSRPARFMESCKAAVHLPVSTGSVVSVAAHPFSDELVVGSFEARLAVVRQQPPATDLDENSNGGGAVEI